MQFNSSPFNTELWTGITDAAVMESTDTLSFEGFSLSDGQDVILTRLNPNGPTRELIGGNVPRGHGQYLTADYFRENTILAEGYVRQSTPALLDAFLDNMKKRLRTREGNLDIIDANGTVKRFIATLTNFEELFASRQSYHVTLCPWTARFACKTPFGKSRSYSSTFLSFSTTPTPQSIVNSGTAPAQPVFYLSFTAASSVTAVTVTNTTTGQSMTYTGSISAGDLLVFDSENKRVLKNGSVVDFSGSFLSLDPGANVITTTVTGSSFTTEVTYKHKDSYL